MLHLRRLGDPSGRPVLFLHPGNATGACWADVVGGLPGISALCPDLPGFGASADTPLIDFATSAEEVAAMLRAEGQGPLPVVGYSMGAYTGMMLALRHPDLVGKALLTGFQVMPLEFGRGMRLLMDVISPLMVLRPMRVRAFRAMGVPEDGSWALSRKAPCDAATLRRIARLAFDFDVRDALPNLAPPTVILAGREEMGSIVETVSLVAARAPDAQGLLAPRGHGWPASEGRLFRDTVAAWLAGAPMPEGLEPV